MIVTSMRLFGLLLIGALVTACSGTKVSSSWSSKDYKGPIENVYLIGIAQNDFNRMHFENTFYQKLKDRGVKAIPSSIDLPQGQEAEREMIIQQMKVNDCDSVLLTRVLERRTKIPLASSKGKGSYSYSSAPAPVGFRPTFSYGTWDHYYSSSRGVIYQPPTTTKRIVLTVESVMYDLKTEDLIWSAQMETDYEGNVGEMMQKFVDKALNDLQQKGLI